ncbi:MAG: AAA family ATPase [Victivallales bacterium]
MKISKVRVRNYRSCFEVTANLSNFTPIVGVNNSGKSNFIRAIAWALKPIALDSSDFNNRNNDITVEFTVDEISNETLKLLESGKHRERIEPFVHDEKIHIRRTMSATQSGAKALNLHVAKGDAHDFDSADWKVNPTGLANALGVIFPDPIIIPAMSDAAEDVTKSKSGTTITRLLQEIITTVEEKHGLEINDALKSAREILDASGTNRSKVLTEIDGQASSELSEIFPGVSVKIHVDMPDIKSIFKAATLKTFEGACERDVTDLGHGTQRSIQMALIRVLAQRAKNNRKGSNTLFLLEEPELYLHPHAIELLSESVKRLSKTGYQVLCVTHSPQMISREFMSSTLLVRKDSANGYTRILPSLKSIIEREVSNHEAQAEIVFDLSMTNDWLFSDKVILFEGATERRLLPYIFKSEFKSSPVAKGAAFVSVDGCGSLSGAKKILESMGIKVKVVCDIDHLVNNPEELDDSYKSNKILLSFISHLGGASNGKRSAEYCKSSLATFSAKVDWKTMCDEFSNRGIWVWEKGDIEAYLGITSKKARDHRDWMKKAELNGWESQARDASGLKAMLHWVVQS